jgi:hypothetical protein
MSAAITVATADALWLPEARPAVRRKRVYPRPQPDSAGGGGDPERRYRQYSGHQARLAGAAQADLLETFMTAPPGEPLRRIGRDIGGGDRNKLPL